MHRLIQILRGTLLVDEGAGETDGQLLDRFLTGRDQPALELLVRRHATMVWGVCRRVLPNAQDAEDAFQATFLVLVRRADAIVPREQVANWLYGVAHQTALKARTTCAKRKGREKQVTDMPEPAVTDRDCWHDLRPLLDQELSRLPDKYRVVIVLSDLEGKTRADVAHSLGLAEGTVASRLARGRALLADRLSGRGVALSGAALAVILGQNVVSAGVPPLILATTIAAVSELAAGGMAAGASSTTATALAEEVVRAAAVPNLTWVGAGLLGAVLLIGVAGLSLASARPDPPPTRDRTPPVASGRVAEVPGAVVTDHDVLQGRWKAVRVAVRGEVVTLGEAEGPEYVFTNNRLAVTHGGGPMGTTPGTRPDRFGGPGGPAAGLGLEQRLQLLSQFGGRGGPWAGLEPDQRQLLAAHLVVGDTGRVGIDFEVRLDERAKSIDHFLTVDGVEKLVVRGVYSVTPDTLLIWDAPPMRERPTARQVQAGDCTTWTCERMTPR